MKHMDAEQSSRMELSLTQRTSENLMLFLTTIGFFSIQSTLNPDTKSRTVS